MEKSQILKGKEVGKILELAVNSHATAVMTHLTCGKWKTTNVIFPAGDGSAIHISTNDNEPEGITNIQIDQPVGISLECNSKRYIFETVVISTEPTASQEQPDKILLAIPEKIEEMGRRAYLRQDVPRSLNVKVLFWHRGYNDGSIDIPLENYWQGKLVNLSAGGVQLTISLEQAPNFKIGQFVGLQFTPMPYEKPITLEGQVKHLAKTTDGHELTIGVHALGLEANSQGRVILHRIIDVVHLYQRLSPTQNHTVAI
jgi:hypothetical protein